MLIKKELRENIESGDSDDLTMEELVESTIRQRTFSLAIDNLLIGRLLHESTAGDQLNSWEGRILEDAYKVLRESLIEIALFIDEYASLTR